MKLTPSGYFIFNSLQEATKGYTLVVRSTKGFGMFNHNHQVTEGFQTVTVPKLDSKIEPTQMNVLLVPVIVGVLFFLFIVKK
jgi:hypothetical protein